MSDGARTANVSAPVTLGDASSPPSAAASPAIEEAWAAAFEGLRALRDRWPAPPSSWSYDRRFKCVMSSIPSSVVGEAEAAIALAMPQGWDAATLVAASSSARATVEGCGGLRASQRLHWGGAGDDGGGPGPFGLWWPWADNLTISLRIGLHDVDLPKVRYPRLRDLFGIPQAASPAG